MAITYGNQVHHWQAGIEASVADKSGAESTKSVITVNVYWHAIGWQYKYYGNGHAEIGTHKNETSYTVFNSYDYSSSVNQLIQTYTYEYDKGTSAQTITCKAICTLTGDPTGVRNGTSTATFDVTVPAKPSYAVKYYENKPSGASGSVSGMPSAQTKWYGTNLTLSKNAPTLSSYGFKGWNTQANGNGTTYSPGGEYKSNAALNLYAIWNRTQDEPVIPADPQAAETQSAAASKPITLDGDSGALWPAWASKASAHQVRWRRRERLYGSSTMGEWSPWSAWGGDWLCDGWGSDPTTATSAEVHITGDTYSVGGAGVPIDLTGNIDRTEIEWGIRAVDASSPVAGGVYGFITTVVREFKVTSVVCNKTYRGVHVSFQTSYTASSVALASVISLDGSFSTSTSTGECDVFIPNASFAYLPEIGDELNLHLSVTSTDGYVAIWTGLITVELGGFYGEAPTVRCTVSGTLAAISATAPTGMSITGAWLVVPRGHGDRYIELQGNSPWLIVPPLGVPWCVLVTASAENRWGFDATVRPAIVEDIPAYHITSQDGRRDFAIALRKALPGPSFAPTYTRSQTETETYARERPVYGYSDTTKAQWSITGDLVDGEGLSDADWAAHASHVYFRSPHGFWAQCAVNSLSVDLSSKESQEVEASLSEEVW